jgi:uncharacterized 2Fe-2S/4Fe-4S cluster protein (DUF4445 family)
MKQKNNRKTKKKKERKAGPSTAPLRRRQVWLNVLPDDLWVKVRRGESIMEALRKVNIDLEGDCGGLVKCGKCRVKVLTSIDFPPESEVHDLLDEEEIKQGFRLACSTAINKDMTVYLDESNSGMEYFQILKAGETPVLQLDPLIDKRSVTLSPDKREEGLSELDLIKLAMEPEYTDIKASLDSLRSLHDKLINTGIHGTAVMHENCLIAWQAEGESAQNYGLVFDLGTSTLVGKLINLTDGSQVAAASSLNRQVKYGTDLIRRIQHVKEDPQGLKTLHEMLIKDLELIIKRLLNVGGLKRDDIFIAVAAGNTTMQHLLLSLNPSSIAEAPFTPVITEGLIVKAKDVDLMLHPEALLYVMPAKSGYIGGDLISVILASGAAEQEDEMILGLDLGTNGEIFIGNRRKILTCSAAAGPALEGARISQGMIAKAGAIEGVRLVNGELRYREIGNVKPKGICGSGLVDLAAVLLNCGIIDSDGLISPIKDGEYQFLSSRVIDRGGVYDFLVASAEESFNGKPIYLTQNDVRELQLAKAAIAAGIKILLKEMGIGLEDVTGIYLAGALGNYVNPYCAMRIGLLPVVNPDIVKSIGNAASTGASMVLLSKEYWKRANELSGFIDHIELSTNADFTGNFIENMNFPDENPFERRSGLPQPQYAVSSD